VTIAWSLFWSLTLQETHRLYGTPLTDCCTQATPVVSTEVVTKPTSQPVSVRSAVTNDAIIIETAQCHTWVQQPTHLRVAESRNAVSDSLKLLGVTLDCNMSFDKHVSTVKRACDFHLSALRHIRSLVADTVTQQIACSIVRSRLDYCKSLLVNCSNRNLDKLHDIARVVCNFNRSTSDGSLLWSLHWLPVRRSTSNSPNFVTWLLLSNSQATLLI